MSKKREKQVLRVCMECDTDSETVYIAVDGTETEEELESMAEDAFFEWANFGFSLIPRSEVPKHADITE